MKSIQPSHTKQLCVHLISRQPPSCAFLDNSNNNWGTYFTSFLGTGSVIWLNIAFDIMHLHMCTYVCVFATYEINRKVIFFLPHDTQQYLFKYVFLPQSFPTEEKKAKMSLHSPFSRLQLELAGRNLLPRSQSVWCSNPAVCEEQGFHLRSTTVRGFDNLLSSGEIFRHLSSQYSELQKMSRKILGFILNFWLANKYVM